MSKAKFFTWIVAAVIGGAVLGASVAQAEQSAGQDLKDAGHSVASATKKTATKIKHGAKKIAHKTAQKVDEGAKKVESKTAPN